ncbi:MAG: AbrB/MazE/SpoVT family DNA-binding domain-containing protein [Chloroflexi bacterium]|nr:AbrB/MazE/SpoVT family DNA-binding domain-containing protein [Chloroflexota bacterium]MYD64685.1 AbrB/MazE/SpoVT family DNA-binding domain-containing protein [Chloroflexota bacterium]
MDETHTVVVGEGGQVVLPAGVLARAGIEEGAQLMLLETDDGLVLLTREQLLGRVRGDLAGLDLVADLLADRRLAARIEDAD